MEIKEQVDFSDFEKEEIKEIKKNKNILLSGKMTIKQRLAAFITMIIMNFMTKLKWQLGLFFYLVIVVPVGTYIVIKNFILLFF